MQASLVLKAAGFVAARSAQKAYHALPCSKHDRLQYVFKK